MITEVKIKIYDNIEATTDGKTWKCKDKGTLKILNMFAKDDNISGYIPSKAEHLAALAVKNLKGVKIVERTEDEYNDSVDGRIY